MKKISVLLTLTALLASTACDELVDIKPQNVIPEAEAVKTTADLQKLLIRAYSAAQSGALYGGNFVAFSEMLADNATGANSFGFSQIQSFSFTFFNPDGRSTWTDAYNVVNLANTAIDRMPEVNDGDIAAQRDRLRGEALFLRAAMHFELVRFFALPYGARPTNSQPGIPLRLQSVQDVNNIQKLPRATVQEVYAQVLKDFTEAASLLPATNSARATSWAAKAYLARVYFQMNDFQNAYAQANDVVSNGLSGAGARLALNASVLNRYRTKNSPESIFEMQSTNFDNSSGGLEGYFRQAGNTPQLYATPELAALALADPNDQRGRLLYNTRAVGANQRTFTTRYDQVNQNAPVLHLAELLLIRAESAAELNNLTTAAADLQRVLDRAYGAGRKTAPTAKADLLAQIRAERRLEMAFENNRVHELKRLRQPVRGLPWDCPKLLFFIPDVEINGNPAIEQNQSAGC
ncbi:RagB/SusD family nutrient uptake outer membrane protein [Hymenobacter weizhouensis]|uniref:RagB/SusD family nutrient uptake outer membrane protein n=1 Tax=Hymenobacter sp. YIM 151500-1 TaxID=2987689 RepID=UPI0022276C2F|nr:RagB/SusD family nutrient uptake outer membrane protein [Hymenobacter sp. YIM 151500-1]UYZ62397.1 RagB/SusD family nutrient uptake outer membrane protein [Hymenobacter sp. YIM 151500-1]